MGLSLCVYQEVMTQVHCQMVFISNTLQTLQEKPEYQRGRICMYGNDIRGQREQRCGLSYYVQRFMCVFYNTNWTTELVKYKVKGKVGTMLLF